MELSEAGLAFIKSWERLWLKAYDDATERVVLPNHPIKGTLTIGWGHTSDAGPPKVYPGMKITAAEAEAILAADLAPVQAEIDRLVWVVLTQPQYDALVSFQFNTGWLEHPHSSLLEAVNAGHLVTASHDFMLYNRSHGRVMKGLTRRRWAEMMMFNTGNYANNE